MLTTFTALAAFTGLASAHFKLDYPAARGFDEDVLTTFPCGGQNNVQSTRTPWPLSGGSIALEMGHINANVEVLIGLGNDVGSAFNTIIKQTFAQTGLGDFCMTGLDLPSGLNVTAGMNATIQVITNGDPTGGLYNCADITFTEDAAPASGVCKNGTGITADATPISTNANVTEVGGATSTTDSPAAASSTPAGAANGLRAGAGGVVAAGFLALALVL